MGCAGARLLRKQGQRWCSAIEARVQQLWGDGEAVGRLLLTRLAGACWELAVL